MSTFGQINLLVRDLEATVAFYRLLELEFTDAFEWPNGSGAEHIDDIHADHAYMAFDNPPMARIWSGGFEPERRGGNVVIGLMVPTREDVNRLVDKVRDAGHPIAREPYDAFFGSRYAIVIDPDGNQVGLKSPIEDDRRYVPAVDDT